MNINALSKSNTVRGLASTSSQPVKTTADAQSTPATVTQISSAAKALAQASGSSDDSASASRTKAPPRRGPPPGGRGGPPPGGGGAPPPGSASSGSKSSSSSSTKTSSKDPADTDGDGIVSAAEKLAYALSHPSAADVGASTKSNV